MDKISVQQWSHYFEQTQKSPCWWYIWKAFAVL